MVATTTNMHNDTGTKSLMTCFAPYLSSSSSSTCHSIKPDRLPDTLPPSGELAGAWLTSPFSWC